MRYKDDGTEIIPELHPEYEGQTNTGINITNLDHIIQRSSIFLECLQDGKEITLAPLQEGVKSVEQALEESGEAAKLYLREKKKCISEKTGREHMRVGSGRPYGSGHRY